VRKRVERKKLKRKEKEEKRKDKGWVVVMIKVGEP
jgi:hypothetical protein